MIFKQSTKRNNFKIYTEIFPSHHKQILYLKQSFTQHGTCMYCNANPGAPSAWVLVDPKTPTVNGVTWAERSKKRWMIIPCAHQQKWNKFTFILWGWGCETLWPNDTWERQIVCQSIVGGWSYHCHKMTQVGRGFLIQPKSAMYYTNGPLFILITSEWE
jgi:hypothetical protein